MPGYRHVSRGKTWRSNDGLITPVSMEGCSPYESPAASPHHSIGLPARWELDNLYIESIIS